MAEPRIIRIPQGEELVVLPRAEYDALLEAANAAEEAEDANAAAVCAERMAVLAEGRDGIRGRQ